MLLLLFVIVTGLLLLIKQVIRAILNSDEKKKVDFKRKYHIDEKQGKNSRGTK